MVAAGVLKKKGGKDERVSDSFNMVENSYDRVNLQSNLKQAQNKPPRPVQPPHKSNYSPYGQDPVIGRQISDPAQINRQPLADLNQQMPNSEQQFIDKYSQYLDAVDKSGPYQNLHSGADHYHKYAPETQPPVSSENPVPKSSVEDEIAKLEKEQAELEHYIAWKKQQDELAQRQGLADKENMQRHAQEHPQPTPKENQIH